MRADPDFTAYVVARWVPVVRMLVVLGQPVDRAEHVAVASLARLLPDWSRLRREGDVDAELARVVLDGWVRTRAAQPAPVPVPVPVARLLTQELEDQLALLERIVTGLRGLDDTTRVAVVLHHVGELDEDQVAEVLGEPRADVRRRLSGAAAALDLVPLDPACHSAATAIDVPPPSVARVVAHAAAGRRRQWQVAGAVVAAVALVAGVVYSMTRPESSEEPDALRVSPVENLVDVAWWVDGTLHLDHGTVPVADLSQMVETGVGVVYADEAGILTAVSEDGTQESVGTMDPTTPIVGQPRLGTVAWMEPDGGDLVVYDAITDREIGGLDITADARVIGWDRERVYFHDADADWYVAVDGSGRLTDRTRVEPPEGGFGSSLLDVSSGTDLRLQDGALSVVPALFSISNQVPGITGQLSPDGNYVLTFVDGRPASFDGRTGKAEVSWFDQEWTPLAAAFTAEGRVVWVMESGDDSFGLYECQVSQRYINSFDPQSEPCTQRLDVDAVPVLAGVQPGLAPQSQR